MTDNVALEVEWSSKDTSFDRDLNNFRLLFELRAVDAGIIITRRDDLYTIFSPLGKNYYVQTTTQISQLLPRLEGGAGGGCPVLVFGISRRLYVADGAPQSKRPTAGPEDENPQP